MRVLMRRAVAAVTCAVALTTSGADASPSARLVYSRAVGADSCPDEDALRQAVASRVGYDPFFAWANKTIVATMAPEKPRGFVARVGLVDEGGTEHGTRDLHTDGDCSDLLGASALAIAIAIDPRSLARPVAAPEPPPVQDSPSPLTQPPPAERTSSAPERLPPAAASSSRVFFEASAGAVASVGFAPAPVAGAAIGVAARSRRWSLGIEGRIDAPATAAAMGGGKVAAWTVLGAVLPCLHGGPVFACAVAEAGAMQASSDGVAVARSTSLAWLAAGLRLGVEVPIQGLTHLRIRSDLVGDLDPATLRLNDAVAWNAPRVAASLGADVVAHF
jgi:hypothetical protein